MRTLILAALGIGLMGYCSPARADMFGLGIGGGTTYYPNPYVAPRPALLPPVDRHPALPAGHQGGQSPTAPKEG
jgi:hypothetical protein